jgi:homoserine acetyltransferase
LVIARIPPAKEPKEMSKRMVQILVAASFLLGADGNSQTMSLPATAPAAQAPGVSWPTVEGTVVLPNFHFGSDETLAQLKLHYLTLGTPHRNVTGHVDNAVLLLHGTGGNAHSLLNPVFSNVLFGPGQLLDITKYFLILPYFFCEWFR